MRRGIETCWYWRVPYQRDDARAIHASGTSATMHGRYTLLARANGADGSVQPDEHDQRYGTYVINHTLTIEVFVAEPASTSP